MVMAAPFRRQRQRGKGRAPYVKAVVPTVKTIKAMDFLGTDHDELVQFFVKTRQDSKVEIWAYWQSHVNERAREVLNNTELPIEDGMANYTLSVERCIIRPRTRRAFIVGYLTGPQ